MAMTYDQSGVYQFDPDRFTQTLTYDGSNNPTSVSITVDGKTFTQTFVYTGSNMTTISPWVKQ